MAVCDTAVYYTARRAPSVKTIHERLTWLSEKDARTVRDILTGRANVLEWGSARRRQEAAFHPHTPLTLAFEALNEAIGGHGVEYIGTPKDGLHDGYGLEYVNMGDTYAATLVYDHGRDTWHVCCWGDIVERDPRFQE